MPEQSPVVPIKVETTPDAGKDPIKVMIEIAENPNLTDTDKTELIRFAQTRFKHRRTMAYIALYALISSLALLFLAAIIDGFFITHNGQPGILQAIKESQTLIAWIEGFLTSIVAAYFGVSAWRPAS